jgi:DNA-binding NarL/FixJ family response regulator
VLVAATDPVVGAGLTAMLRSGGVDVVGLVSGGLEAVEPAQRLRPDLVVLDVPRPGLTLRRLTALTRVLVVRDEAGAAGQLARARLGPERLLAAVRDAVARRESPSDGGLTERETEIMDLVARGCANAEIAQRLGLSGNTVRNHVGRIYMKLGVANRGAAIARWLGTAPDPPAIRRVS